MTNRQFSTWMKKMGFTPAAAAAALGVCQNTIYNYVRGNQAGTDRPAPIPKVVALACKRLLAYPEAPPAL